MNQPSASQTLFLPLRHIRPFISLLMQHFTQDRGIQHVAALTYTTLLSLVPLMTVMLALFSVFPASERMSEQIENFLFQNFVPAAGEAVQQHLRNFSQKAAQLTGVGFLFLILVALLLMNNIDQAFNTIWHVRNKRSPLAKFTVYWAILSLGPILIAISVGVTSYFVSIPLFDDAQALVMVRSRLLSMMPILISALAFTLLYALVPNRSVMLRHAIAGGIIAALLFEATKRGFALYVTNFPTYEAIYGTLAVMPIFLIWIYLSWLVTLLGAEFTYCLSIYREDWRESMQQRGGKFLFALQLLQLLCESQRQGLPLTTRQLQECVKYATEEQLEFILISLQKARLVLHTDEKGWVLARDLRKIKLIELYRSDAYVLPGKQQTEGASDNLRGLLGQLNDNLQEAMDHPLDELLK
ncbi:MAG: virulence factor BrkB family protein [Candidatus Thiodiazotropha sp. (ex Lucinoma aequizonata)]|nr:virulence factor BrkB family protein [Candidatus Thiodiazotropha sp. (ex Lucinoma aequizonata)]MCU7889165.1 virulence factor BrkB family protein [Candidatus Thiodiazotropha sp. (ex Lucinoma aequizonata)]MCU7895590.1 virulence factor BrkB family protein [Candidatus Thiodiazotropha sp. (ex Lucinoma aequizonata)]MCU7897841.1 virulence factor BrkB family protein [Candidatus Thiodiazotropha sp. (ex Lucinoma aequizonata)]MCU7903318.1 virulence factor BrkB family protein [Candidatus Thiodiazotropha